MPGVCIVAPSEKGEQGDVITTDQRQWVTDLRALAQERKADVKIFRTVFRTSNQKGEKGRRFSVLDPWEAERLYRLTHRGYSAVFQTGSARILKDPTKLLESSNTMTLKNLMQHKVFFSQFDGFTAAADSFDVYDEWTANVRCENHRDCRALPLHMFAPNRDWGTLAERSSRNGFEQVHGKPLHLKDERSRPWKQATARHGNDTLTVANYELPTGFHWDVEASQNRSRMSSLTDAWRFDSGAYLNISPDGHARGGQSSGVSAVKEGQAPRPPIAEPAGSSKNNNKTHTRKSRQGRQRRH